MKTVVCVLFAAGVCLAQVKLGKPLTLKESMSVDKLMSTPDAYVGKTVQVKGKVTEVCQMMGCWMNLTDGGKQMIRIKVNDGDIVFPKDAPGKVAIAEGKLSKQELTKEEVAEAAKHEADEQGRDFDPATVKSGKTIYQIDGSGAVIE
jgi:hypothetical protein